MKYFIIIFLSIFIATNSQSQIPNSPIVVVDSATMYLTGTFKKYNPAKAFQLFMQRAINGEAKAMNAVAIQYMKGVGIDSNFNLAVYWFNQAATNGYTKSLVNLGMLFKHKATDSIGYSTAYHYFIQGVQASEPSGYFAQGYMLYKGLGCTQSYTSALALFNQGIALNQSNCMYFKGLCYKLGYGVSINADSANYYIDTAAKLGYKQANAELANNPNNTASRQSTSVIGRNEANSNPKLQIDEFINIKKTNNPIKLNGEFVGEILQYDYSGKKLLSQIPIILSFSKRPTPNVEEQGVRLGTLKLNNNQTIELKAIQQGNQLIFSQTAIPLSLGRGVRGEASKLQTKLLFRSATLHLETKNDTNYLTGTLQLFNTYTNETYKPINIKLSQVIARNEAISTNEKQETRNVLVYPNPTKNNFTILFNLSNPSPVKINIYNQQGQVVYTKMFEQLPQGKNQILINPALEGREAGIYIIKLFSNEPLKTTAFIKE